METKQEFIEPSLIKAGDSRVRLGMHSTPPKVDCRVIAEAGYQQLKRAFDMHDELLDELKNLIRDIEYPQRSLRDSDGCMIATPNIEKSLELIKKAE